MTDARAIAVVGASARAAAQSLLRAGFCVVAADRFADADLRCACPTHRVTHYPDELSTWLAEIDCQGWLYTGALENEPALIDRLTQLRPLLGNAGDVLRRVRDPRAVQQTLQESGLAFPPTRPSREKCLTRGRWLFKTGRGGGGSGVRWQDAANPPAVPGYWQQYEEGTPGSAVYLAQTEGCHLLGVTRQLVGEPWLHAREFQYCGSLGPWPLPDAAQNTLVRLGELLGERFALRGLFGVDFVWDEPTVWPVEVNPRVTAAVEVLERITGASALAAHVAAFGAEHGISGPPVFPENPFVGKAILFAREPLTVSAPLSASLLIESLTSTLPLDDIPTPGTRLKTGDPVLTVLAHGSSLAEVQNQLRRAVARLESEFYGKRSAGIETV